ncbi:unnamed protein product [Moneuplotes crassus]|uniref:Uncharacterized protein n=1 Tax=Euplotes crassus TaxID=5936 RepID=A0AAD1X311_EUPCR|nr:unnamed protein product [Moneuplotes crassus]
MGKNKEGGEQQSGSTQEINLKSPRTIEAAKRQGYLIKELKFQSFPKFKDTIVDLKVTDDIIKLRWERMEAKRQEKVQNVLQERQTMIEADEVVQEEPKSAKKKSDKLKPGSSKAVNPYPSRSVAKNRNGHGKSVSFLADSPDRKLAIEVQYQNDKRRLSHLKKAKKSMIDGYIKKIIQKEEDQAAKEELLYQKRLEIEREKELKLKKENKFRDKIARIRAQELFEKQKNKELTLQKIREENIKKEQEKIARLERQALEKRQQEIHNEKVQLDRERRIREQIDKLIKERQEAETYRRKEVEKKLSLLEEKNRQIDIMKKERAEKIRQEHRQKYEVALQNVQRKEFEKQLMWERNQMILSDKYKKIKKKQIEKEKSMIRKKANKDQEIRQAKEANDEHLRLKLEEFKEKERKFEERLLKHKEKVKLRQKEREDYEEMKRMERDIKKQRILEESELKKNGLQEKLNKEDQRSRDLKLQKEKEKKISIELEAIKKRERLEEAKRLERKKAYTRYKQIEKIEQERSKSSAIKEKINEIVNQKVNISKNAVIMKDQIKERIRSIKATKPDKISKVKINNSMNLSNPTILDLSFDKKKDKSVIINPEDSDARKSYNDAAGSTGKPSKLEKRNNSQTGGRKKKSS